MSFFNEVSEDSDSRFADLQSMIEKKIDVEGYEMSCRNRFRHPIADMGAVFSPFDMGTKAFQTFVPYLKRHLKKGDVILDIANRTGWSTSMLAGFFPEQKVISLWEGDTGILGYSGIAYWFASEERATNIEVLFASLEKKLPFADKSVALIVGFDVMHRQLRSTMIDELARISTPDGLILFPHVPLGYAGRSTSIDEAAGILHIHEYETYFSRLDRVDKKVHVFSESDLVRNADDPGTGVTAVEGNGDRYVLVALCRSGIRLAEHTSVFDYFDHYPLSAGTLIPNPLLEVGGNNSVKSRTDSLANEIGKLLGEDADIARIINAAQSYALSDEELMVFYWASRARPVEFIMSKMGIEGNEMRALIDGLRKREILQIFPLQHTSVRLQHLLAFNEYIEKPAKMNLQHFWKRAVRGYAQNTYVKDRSDNTFYTYEEFDAIVARLVFTMMKQGIKKGDNIVLHGDIHFESMALFWACMHLGVVFISISSAYPEKTFVQLQTGYDPAMVFLSRPLTLGDKWHKTTVFFDDERAPRIRGGLYFSEWLEETTGEFGLPEIKEEDIALVLHTSGSTGMPKGVALTHGHLFQNAVNMVSYYGWDHNDRYLSFGQLDTMTGLRNACLVTVESGSACILPGYDERNNLGESLDDIFESGITMLITSPGHLYQFLGRKELGARIANVRYILSMGSRLSGQLKRDFYERTNKHILSWYGLTETAGFCIAHKSENLRKNSVGRPVDCLVQLVDEGNVKVRPGEVGEIRVYGYNISPGYWSGNLTINKDDKGWFYTGDLAREDAQHGFEIMGRKSEYIKNGRGEIIFFKEIEDAISRLPFVKDFGVTSFFRDEAERLALFVELDSDAPPKKDIQDVIIKEISTNIGRLKIPSLIKVIDKIPRSTHGKLLKKDLEQYL